MYYIFCGCCEVHVLALALVLSILGKSSYELQPIIKKYIQFLFHLLLEIGMFL